MALPRPRSGNSAEYHCRILGQRKLCNYDRFSIDLLLGAQAALQSAASGNQVDDQHNQGDDQQKVNQSAGDVEAEAQDPQNQKDDEDCPKHMQHLSEMRTPETVNPAQAHATNSQAAVSWMQSLALLPV